MRHLLITLILLLSLTGCQDKEKEAQIQAERDAQIAKKVRAEVLAEVEKEKQETMKNEKFNKVGININNGTITIDTNKTKDFFKKFSKSMEAKMKKISDDLQQGIVDSKEAGININNEHVNIDLNKTKTFLEDWAKKIQVFAHEFDNISKDLDNMNTNKGQ